MAAQETAHWTDDGVEWKTTGAWSRCGGVEWTTTEHTDGDRSGAAEHSCEYDTWTGGINFVNIGLTGKAVAGHKWLGVHRPGLLKLLLRLMQIPGTIGHCLAEVGNLDDLLSQASRDKFDGLLEEAYTLAGHGRPQIMWPKKPNETVATWTPDTIVEHLRPFEYSTPTMLRTCERFLLTGAAEHGNNLSA